MYSAEEKIKWFAVSSRIFVFLLQALANYLITDHEPGVFTKPLPHNHTSAPEKVVHVLTSGLTRWDAQYFLHIAEYGYTYENTLAFFPLFPLILRSLAYPFQLVANNAFHCAAVPFFLTTHLTIILMAVVLNNLLFVHSSILLYRLTLKLTNNEKCAYMSALLFCINPASIFFSAAYSETIFCFLTLNALLYIESSYLSWGSLLIGLSSIARSNGIVNIGFIVHRTMKTRRNVFSLIFALIVLVSCAILALMPFAAFQYYGFIKFCVERQQNLPEFLLQHARNNSYRLPGSESSWCQQSLPLAYTYIQKTHWNVGFLNYYEAKQLPNFILAFPVLAFSFYGVFRFFYTHGFTLLGLGFSPGSPAAFLPSACFSYMLHLLFLSLFSLLFMHVQVSTRFIFSSSPAIYWICAEIVLANMPVRREESVARKISKNPNAFYEPVGNNSSKWKTILITERFLSWALMVRYYFFAYFLVGPVIFSNNLPWT